ncbi:hypothetical protein AMK59_2998 [Oryctes borbonicus]|uniref:Lysosome-associated membrane glycoprotein 5 n=1 Tax=Oryctes borbonicus TaxID=1629725 RepID=A0A0T6BFX9_9SCAR|nr:hypothetical protein AMK59_2998 [Oryctes borbonicus]
MKLLGAAILLTTITFCAAADGVDPEPVTSPSTTSPTSSPTTSATTPSTTSKVTTSAITSSTTSTTSITTTTTTSPSTSSTTPSTTTSTSTSTARPTETPTTVVPPSPGPKPGTWEVKNSTNSSCILLKMVAELAVNFNGSQIFHAIVPTNATVSGSCGNATHENQTMILQWSYVNGTSNTMEFVFSKKDKKFELDMVNISLVVDSSHFKNTSGQRLNLTHKEVDFVTPVDMSYKCVKEQTLNFDNVNNATNITASLKISQFQFQAFGNITNKHFADAKDCEPYETPDIVPIAVGCALMALIIIVLVGYLIGRRRNQARGYLSM